MVENAKIKWITSIVLNQLICNHSIPTKLVAVLMTKHHTSEFSIRKKINWYILKSKKEFM